MPTYTFRCSACGAQCEVITPISQYTSIGPVCCYANMTRSFEFNQNEPPVVIFKGDGWPSQDLKRERLRGNK